ncbi:MAG: hypothetical protein ACI9TV_002027 [Sulfurimonas sp.]|jgi:hypothetical protein|uniref:hypothetical protein n=1 Tax=Sulfurimonas sp. TaxID=2022749 RepID=UPI0039E5C349
MLKRITENPYLNLISGLILLFTSAFETWKSLEEGLGLHHGILLFSLIHIVKAIPEAMHGFKELDEANNEIKAKINS